MSYYSLYSPLSCPSRLLQHTLHGCDLDFFFFQNRGAAHSKTPKVLSGFPISPDSGSSEQPSPRWEKELKSRELTGFNCSQLIQLKYQIIHILLINALYDLRVEHLNEFLFETPSTVETVNLINILHEY